MIEIALVLTSLAFAFLAFRARNHNASLVLEAQLLREQASILEKQLENSIIKASEQEAQRSALVFESQSLREQLQASILMVAEQETCNSSLVTTSEEHRSQIAILQKQLEELLCRIGDQEKPDSASEGLLEKVVTGLVGLGIPGLILLVAITTSGLAGAAAITSALALLGGPFGMLGGISALLLLALASKALAQYGLPRVSALVVKGLLTKGYSVQGIRDQIRRYPRIISGELRSKIEEILNQNS